MVVEFPFSGNAKTGHRENFQAVLNALRPYKLATSLNLLTSSLRISTYLHISLFYLLYYIYLTHQNFKQKNELI
jgi:hypothetical protein